MRLDISLETEARLVAKAQEQGLSIDAFLERLSERRRDAGARHQRRRSSTPSPVSWRARQPSPPGHPQRLMSSPASNLVNKVWNYCNLLRDDGVSYGDYVEQLTYLLFLKMDYERTRPPYKHKSTIPEDYNWASLVELDGTAARKALPQHPRKPRQRARHPRHHLPQSPEQDPEPRPACAASSSISSTRNRGARSAPTSRATSTKVCSKRTRRTPSPAPASTSRLAPLIDAIVDVMRPQPGTTIMRSRRGHRRFPPRRRQPHHQATTSSTATR